MVAAEAVGVGHHGVDGRRTAHRSSSPASTGQVIGVRWGHSGHRLWPVMSPARAVMAVQVIAVTVVMVANIAVASARIATRAALHSYD